ncbi:MAG: DNA/RNA non-specific endonuclease [Chloracidobacterium sp.]|nr:DNA/RNA non-specific endonuclease [Chloracidobacterium sp.]
MSPNAPGIPLFWKLCCRLLTLFVLAVSVYGQDGQTDHSSVHPDSKALEYLLPLFTIHGVPKNEDPDNPVTILVNHGSLIGFSKKYNQPLWAAYQVSKVKRDVDYERFPFFVDDLRLPAENRIGTETFGNGYDLGHLVPNAATNRQYAKLSQMESFLMSNISPQKASLNRGVWQKLEFDILNRYPNAGTTQSPKHHVWVIVGPVFGDNPAFITRNNGSRVPIPDSFFCILVRPKRYPYDSPGNADYLTFLFAQEQTANQQISLKFVKSINHIETLAKLNFFPELTAQMEDKIENGVAAQLW